MPLWNSYRAYSKTCQSPHRGSRRFPQGGDTLADADAHGGGGPDRVTTAHLVQERGDDPRAGAAERVTDGDRATVDIHLLRVELELVDDRDRLRGERLVHLGQLEVLRAPSGTGERAVHRGHRADPHIVRVHPGRRGTDVAGDRRHARAVDRLLGHEQQGGASVVQRRGVTAGHGAALAERWLLGGELLERDGGVDALVRGDLALAGGHRDDLGAEAAGVARGGGQLVTAQRPLD